MSKVYRRLLMARYIRNVRVVLCLKCMHMYRATVYLIGRLYRKKRKGRSISFSYTWFYSLVFWQGWQDRHYILVILTFIMHYARWLIQWKKELHVCPATCFSFFVSWSSARCWWLTSTIEEEALPMTLYLCQWNAPCKWKERAMLISTFRKHVYAMQQKHELKPIEDLYVQNYLLIDYNWSTHWEIPSVEECWRRKQWRRVYLYGSVGIIIIGKRYYVAVWSWCTFAWSSCQITSLEGSDGVFDFSGNVVS